LIGENEFDRALADLSQNIELLTDLLDREPQLAQARDALYRSHGIRAGILDRTGKDLEACDEWQLVVNLSAPAERSNNRLFLILGMSKSIRHREAVAEVDDLSAEADVRDDAQFLWNLAKVCSLSIASANRERSNPAHEPTVREYRAKADLLLARAQAVAEPNDWESLAKEIQTDPGFDAFRTMQQ
jgi:hypothetical protein